MMQHVFVVLIALIVLYSLSGCSQVKVQEIPRVPIVLKLPASVVPPKPELPKFKSNLPFDHKANVKILLLRDDIMRSLIKALYMALGDSGEKKEEKNNDRKSTRNNGSS